MRRGDIFETGSGLSQAQANELLRAYSSSRGGPARSCYQAVRLYSLGYPVAQIQSTTGCSRPQEQVWKATRRAVSHCHLVPRLPDLAERFKHHLTSTTFHTLFLDRYAFNQVRMMLN